MVTDQEWAWNDEPTEALALVEPARPVAGHGAGTGMGFNGQKYPGGWGLGDLSFVDNALNFDYFTLRHRSHRMFETNPYARGIIRRLVTNEVHTGLQLEASPLGILLPGMSEDQLHAWSDKTEVLFSAWSNEYTVCDFERRVEMTFGELTAMARREALIGGDVLVIVRQDKDTKLPTVQLISAHQVASPMSSIGDTLLRDGVEIDKDGRHIAYHVRSPHNAIDFETTRIPAIGAAGQRQAWLMYGTDRRTGTHRGVPLLSIVLQSLREIDRYRDATQRKAVISSILSMWIEKTDDKIGSLPATSGAIRAGEVSTTNYDGAARTWNSADQIPGLVWEELQKGEKPHAFKADGGDTVQFPEFEAAILRAIAWSLELPPEILQLSFEKNYSASAAALGEVNMYLDVTRPRVAKSFNQPIYETWLAASVRRGDISAPGLTEALVTPAKFMTKRAWVNAVWIGSIKAITDKLKEAKAAEIRVDRGWSTNAREARALNGTKFAANAAAIMREREMLPPVEEPDPAPAVAMASLLERMEVLEEKQADVVDDNSQL